MLRTRNFDAAATKKALLTIERNTQALLPLLKDSVKESPDNVVVSEEACLAGIRVLVVDDEVDILNLIIYVLK
ncbi:MAG: hypothetical protein KME29_36600 [Calothrix sp. FI2-JRJ7]|nr:hypothetical protein [Calothrix sp. FI2-JRJ7]